jgi:hypothetical protein
MTPTPPYIALPLRPHISSGLAGLTARSRTGLSDKDKKIGAELLGDAYNDVIEHTFVQLLRALDAAHPDPELQEGLRLMAEIQEKIQHYLGWVVGFFSSERLIPVIAHFNQVTVELGDSGQAYSVFPIKPRLAADSQRVLTELSTGKAGSMAEGAELMIHVIEAALDTLVHQPKDLMKFNFVVRKTLDGVINLLFKYVRHMVRKLAGHLPRDSYPIVGGHLAQFLVVR